jgi:hypothetical protein
MPANSSTGSNTAPLGDHVNFPVFAYELPGYPSFLRIIEADYGDTVFLYLETVETDQGFRHRTFPVLHGPRPLP